MALKKALWVVPVGNFGGVARHVVDAATAGLPGYELVLLAPNGDLTDAVRQRGVRVIADDSFGVDAGFKASFAALYRAVKNEQPDILHTHLAYADIVGVAVMTVSRIQNKLKGKTDWTPALVTTEHGIAPRTSVYNKNRVRGLIMRLAHSLRLGLTDLTIAVSYSTAQQMKRQWGARTVEVVYNGIDTSTIRAGVAHHRVPSQQTGPRILSLSRLAPEKGLDSLIEAFARVQKDYADASLEIAGSGELENDLEQQVEHLGLSNSVRFSGFVDPLEAMGRNDIVVQLSVWENLSYTLLDAKAAGLNVVATDVGGNSEILDDTELIPCTESEAPQNTAIARAIEAEPQRVGTAFSWQSLENMAQRTAELYTQTLKNLRRRNA